MTAARHVVEPAVSANVAQALVDMAAAQPDRPALLGGDGRPRLTYAELAERAASIASGLACRGLRPGGRVVPLTGDPEQALISAVATLWAGGTLVLPPASSGRWAVLRAAGRTNPTAVLADPQTWLVLAAVPALRRARIRVTTGWRHWPALVTLDELARGGHPAADPMPRAAEAPALISWTTGTTGRPHAVVRTHGVLSVQHAAIRHLREPRPNDVDLVGLPAMTLNDLACGVSVVIPPRPDVDPDGSLLRALVVRAGVTTAVGFPVLFERLVAGAGAVRLPGLRSIHVGGAPVRRDLVDRLTAVAPNASIVIVYGATEAEPIAAIDADEWRSSSAGSEPGRGMLVGRPWDGIDLRVVPLEAPAGVPMSAGSRGRILVRGDRVARDPIRSDPDGWLDTGDVGRIDDEGRLWLLGRCSNMLAGGVAPVEPEGSVAALQGVDAAALIVLRGGTRPRLALAVQPDAGADPMAVRARIATLAADRGWNVDLVAILHRIPRDARTGKVDERQLRALIR